MLICGIVLVALLLSLDTLPEDSHHQGEYYALIVFGAVGMCLLTGAVELLVVFIALEISSIATYVLAGYRKDTGRGPEAAIKYFLLGSFATGFLLYGIALIFGATGTTQIYEIARLAPTAQNHSLVLAALALMLVGILFKVSAAPFHVWTPDVYEGAPSPVVALLSTAPKAAAFALLLRVVYEMFPSLHAALDAAAVGGGRALHDRGQPGRAAPAEREAHAGLLVDRACRLPAGRLCRPGRQRHRRRQLLHRRLRRHECGHLCRGHAGQRIRRKAAPGRGFPRPDLPVAAARQPADLLPGLAGRHSLHRRILRQVLLLLGRGGRRRVWLAIIGLLNSGLAAAYYLRLALAAAQKPASRDDDARLPDPQIGIAVGAALFFAVAATLWLGILPSEVLRAAENGAHTLQRRLRPTRRPPLLQSKPSSHSRSRRICDSERFRSCVRHLRSASEVPILYVRCAEGMGAQSVVNVCLQRIYAAGLPRAGSMLVSPARLLSSRVR